MRKTVPFGLGATIVASILTLTGYSVTAASQSLVLPPLDPAEWHEEPTPTPVKTTDPSDDFRAGNACIPSDQILGVFALDVQHVGGEILALDDGLQQAFADSWRKAVGLPKIEVAHVYAHIVSGDDGSSIVDVVEIGKNGCALSRTLLSMDSWLEILKPLKGIEV